MIESAKSINENIYLLENNDVLYKTFTPIIETIKGVNNLSSIANHKGISCAIYGHNDYSLDSRHWSFFEQDEIQFWQIVSLFIKKVETKGVCYVHPPIPYFSNELLSAQVCLELQTRCSYPYSIMTVNNSQTALFNRIKNSALLVKKRELKSYLYSLKIDQALYVIKIFSKKKRNFGIDLNSNKFFSPHMYISARKFLEEFNE